MKSMLSKIKADLKRIKDSVIRERLLLVQDAFKYNLRDVARTFGCTHGKVAYWKNRYIKGGVKGLHTKEKSGRPSMIKPEIVAKIKRKVRRHNIKKGWTTKYIREVIRKESGIKYCERQIIRLSQKWGLAQIIPRKLSAYSKKEDREKFKKKT